MNTHGSHRATLSIAPYMTPGPYSVEAHESLSHARGLMRDHGVRHLPVMRKGKLVGILSDRDANLVEGLAYAPADAITVEDAMTRAPYVVAPDAALEDVVHAMIARKIGSAVVMEGSAVVGVFTTSDALRAFADDLQTKHDSARSGDSNIEALPEPRLGDDSSARLPRSKGRSEAKRVRHVMTKGPMFATPEMPLREVARMMTDGHVGAIPIVDDPVTLRPVGLVTDRDISCRAVAEGKNPLLMTAGECMSSPCVVVSDADSIDTCRKVLAEKQIRRVPVVDGTGAVCGIIALADIARHLESAQVARVVRAVSRPTEWASALEERSPHPDR